MRVAARWVRAHAGARWRDERGAAAVEMALVLPVLMLLIFGMIEFGRAWNVRQTLTDAAREGARVAVVNNGVVTPATALRDSVDRTIRRSARRAGLDESKLMMYYAGIGSGETATVTINYTYQPLVSLVLKNPITMQTATTMRNE